MDGGCSAPTAPMAKSPRPQAVRYATLAALLYFLPWPTGLHAVDSPDPVTFARDVAPIFQNHCQCRDCQRRSGTGHGSYLTFPARAEMTITGEPT